MISVFYGENIQWYFRPKSGYKITRAFYAVGAGFYAYILDYELRDEYFLSFNEEPTPNDIFAEAIRKHEERKSVRNKDSTFSSRMEGMRVE